MKWGEGQTITGIKLKNLTDNQLGVVTYDFFKNHAWDDEPLPAEIEN